MSKKRELAISLHGPGGELDRHTIEVREDQDESAVIGNALIGAIEEWSLAVGDSIRIEEHST